MSNFWRVLREMFNKLRTVITAGLLTSAISLGSVSQALTLDCQNKSSEHIALAVSYLSNDGKTWIVEGWYNLQSQEHALIELPSNNDIFYIFGEFGNNIKVSGGEGSVNMPVVWNEFQYVQADPIKNHDAVESFVRGVATNGYAEISFGPFNN